jgi:MFS family permease
MDRFNLSIREINLFGTCINIGLWVGFPMGFIYDKFGPKISSLLGTILLGGGYLSLHFIMNTDFFLQLDSLSIYPLLFLAFLIGQGASICYTTGVTTNLKNFRFKDSSSIVGLLVSNMAIAPSIFTTFKENIKILTVENFFFIISIFISSIILLCVFTFNNMDRVYSDDKIIRNYEKFKEKKIIRIFIFTNIFILIIYVFGVLYNYFSQEYIFPLILIYPSMQLLNFLIVLLEKFSFFDRIYLDRYKRVVSRNNVSASVSFEMSEFERSFNTNQNNPGRKNTNANNEEFFSENGNGQDYKGEVPFLVALKSKNLIILFIILVLGVGSVISNLNNIHFVLKSILHKTDIKIPNDNIIIYKDKDLFIYVILYFVSNCSTRLISGLFLDHLIKNKKFFYYIFFMSIVGFFSQFLGIFMNKGILMISIALAGMTHGGYMTFTPTFARNLFGLRNMGKILGFLTTGSAVGSLLISDMIFIFPYFYFGKDEDDSCTGKICFYPSYMITSFLFLINIMLSYIMLRGKRREDSMNLVRP